jgi:V/A-type H+-transporting ATPase subunit K
MVTFRKYKRGIFVGLAIAVGLLAMTPFALAAAGAEEESAGVPSSGAGWKEAGLAIGAGIAIAGAGLGTGRAQAGVGAGGTGALAEKPELFGNVLILFAIPETMVVFGFVIAIMLVNKIL